MGDLCGVGRKVLMNIEVDQLLNSDSFIGICTIKKLGRPKNLKVQEHEASYQLADIVSPQATKKACKLHLNHEKNKRY